LEQLMASTRAIREHFLGPQGYDSRPDLARQYVTIDGNSNIKSRTREIIVHAINTHMLQHGGGILIFKQSMFAKPEKNGPQLAPGTIHKSVMKLVSALCDHGIIAAPFHSVLTDTEKALLLRNFANRNVHALITTDTLANALLQWCDHNRRATSIGAQ
jgi:hypothetical protein